MKRKKVLLIGPFPNPISGVSIANSKVEEILRNSQQVRVDKIDMSFPDFNDTVGKFSFKKLIFFFFVNLSVYKVLGAQIIYITPGQSFFGILKYAPFILLSSILKKEIIIHVHGNYLHLEYQSLKGIKKWIFSFLISRCTKGIVLSSSLQRNLTPFLAKHIIQIISNFADQSLFDVIIQKSDELRIIYLSNLMDEKGIVYLLNALEELSSQNITFEARIAGNIDAQNEEKLRTKMKKIPQVTYLGVVQGREKTGLLEWGTVFVLPTFYKMEGQPISILEAMATGNVVLTTKHSGIPDIFENEVNGFYIEKQDTQSITSKLKMLNEQKEKIESIGKRNKEYATERFSEEVFAKKILDCFDIARDS